MKSAIFSDSYDCAEPLTEAVAKVREAEILDEIDSLVAESKEALKLQ